MNIKHPKKVVVPIEAGLAWGEDGAIYQQKYDGEFRVMSLPDCSILVGEQIGTRFIAFDCVSFVGLDVRNCPLTQRIKYRDEICYRNHIDHAVEFANGSALLAEVLLAGGEGVVRKTKDSTYYETMIACKRSQIFICRITTSSPKQSASITDVQTGVYLGNVPMLGGKADQVRVGSIIRVEAETVHSSGKLRGAKLCREWLVKY